MNLRAVYLWIFKKRSTRKYLKTSTKIFSLQKVFFKKRSTRKYLKTSTKIFSLQKVFFKKRSTRKYLKTSTKIFSLQKVFFKKHSTRKYLKTSTKNFSLQTFCGTLRKERHRNSGGYPWTAVFGERLNNLFKTWVRQFVNLFEFLISNLETRLTAKVNLNDFCYSNQKDANQKNCPKNFVKSFCKEM